MTTETPTQTRENVIEWLEERQSRFITMSDTIWATPELALAEYKSSRLQMEDLRADGFTITENIGELPTAFMAEWGNGGPIIGFLGEYDALPGLSQERQDTQVPIEAEGPGHGCGHNLLGTASLAAASVVKAWLQVTGTPGTVRYYGCPAEETGEGKSFMARAGAFDDLDLALTWHPGSTTTGMATSSLAVNGMKYRFRGRTAHAAGNPETGRSSLDAVELMNVGVNYLREHIPDAARIHYVITNGGGAPNVVPDDAEVWYFLRSPERYQVDELVERVRKVAQGAALMTETTLEEIFISGGCNYLPNLTLTNRLMDILNELGPIEFTDEERTFARNISESFPDDLRRGLLRSRDIPESRLDEGLAPEVFPLTGVGKVMPGSTDVSDVSWIAPTAQFTTTCHPLGTPGHSWAITSTSGMSIGHKGMIHAAKAMAIAAADAVLDPSIIAEARAEFEKATAGRPFKSAIPPEVRPRVS